MAINVCTGLNATQSALAFRVVVVFLLSLMSSKAFAGFCLDPRVWPETVTVSTVAGQTSLTFGPVVAGRMNDERITVAGGNVTIEGWTTTGCDVGQPPPLQTQTFAVGMLGNGTYNLRVIHYIAGGPFILFRSFTVGPVPGPPLTNLRAVPNPAQRDSLVSARLLFTYNCLVPGPSTVQIQGSVVTLRHNLVSVPCVLPPGPADVDFPLGIFPPGHYTLVYAPTRETFVYETQSTQFTVLSGTSTAAVPATDRNSTLLLALLVLAATFLAMRSVTPESR